ncbi:MAG: DNA-processing protein DprA [Ruminococcus sp.]|nr:DNA-processing protein DprA [Ruminococcus sp.]
MENIKYLIWLNMALSNDYKSIWQTIKSHDKLENAYFSIISGKYKIKLTDRQLKKINETSLEKAEEVVAYCAEKGVNIIRYGSENYPEKLINIEYPPLVLYCKGNISCLSDEKNITCVGTRKPSKYTVSVISRLCMQLAENGFTIVSGFAEGSDINANLSAINMKRPTVCVLGCGIDVNYPKSNYPYREKIIENGGLFVSEYTPLEKSHPFKFPKRNRILVALSDTTLVFEASGKSGSLSIAEEAVRQNKKLLCLPPADIFDSRYAGNIRLLRDNAKPLYSIEDIFRIYNMKDVISTETIKDCTEIPAVRNLKTVKNEKDTIKNKSEESVVKMPDRKISEHSFTPVQQKILDLLDNCTLHIDVIISKFDMDISEIMLEIMELQFMGVIEETAGSIFRKC